MDDMTPLRSDVLSLQRSMLETSTIVMQRQRRLEQELLQANERLETLVRDKVALLQEVHHRVKNNLQVITSLLRLEAGRSVQADTIAVLGDMQGRIRSMALLHETLYRSGEFASINLGAYLKNLAMQAHRTLSTPGSNVRLELDLSSVTVSLDQATPCGLLVNELISNSLKHGFPAGLSGELRVELHALKESKQAMLRVSDTGVGLPPDFDDRQRQSLGLQLVTALTHQLGGTLQTGPAPLATFSVIFPCEPAPEGNEPAP